VKRFRPLLTLVLAVLAATPTSTHAAKKFASPYVDLFMASAMTPAGGKPSVVVGLANRTATTLWVRVRFQSPPGAAACDSATRLAPKARALLGCPQDSLLGDTDYAFTVSVYLDSSLARPQDENASSVRFRSADLAEFGRLTDSMQLPQTFENVVHTEKLGLGSVMMAGGGAGNRLVVGTDAIDYAADKGPIHITASQITAVKLAPGGSFGPWLVVQYTDAGDKRLLALRPSPTHRAASVDLMRASLDQLAATTRAK